MCKAYSIVRDLLKLPDANLRDFFSASECALRLNLFSDVIDLSSKVIILSQENSEEYFLDQSYFWRAYSMFKMGRLDLAMDDVEHIKDCKNTFYVASFVPGFVLHELKIKDLIDMIEGAGIGGD